MLEIPMMMATAQLYLFSFDTIELFKQMFQISILNTSLFNTEISQLKLLVIGIIY